MPFLTGKHLDRARGNMPAATSCSASATRQLGGSVGFMVAAYVEGGEALDEPLADLDDLRALLDEAAVAVHAAEEVMHRLNIEFSEHGNAVPAKVRNRVAKRGRVVVSLLSRMQVRLGQADPVVQHLDTLSRALWTAWQQAKPALDPDEPGTMVARFDAMRTASDDFGDAAEAFIEAAVGRAGTVTTPMMRFRLTEESSRWIDSR